ncbi:MAG: HAMP domain-containing histidine kinase [bacterium]|nr:HAMP domain-containing histidine kinase [bacterium]
MENILLQRLKHLNPVSNVVRVVFTLVAVIFLLLYFLVFKAPEADEKGIYQAVLNGIHQGESFMEKRNRDFQKRSKRIYGLYNSDKLQHSALYSKEALIIEKNGVIEDYWGGIYYFKFKPLETGDWSYIVKQKDVYFIQKMGEHLYYVRYFFNMDRNVLLDRLKFTFAVSEIKVSNVPLYDQSNEYLYDNVKDLFFYRHYLAHSNDQFVLYLKFYKKDIDRFYHDRERLFWFSGIVLVLAFSLILALYYRKSKVMVRWLWLGLLADLYFLLPTISAATGQNSLYLKFDFGGYPVVSIYQLLVLLLFSISALYFLRHRFKIRLLCYLLFNGFLVMVFKFSEVLINGVNFNYRQFSLNYLVLVTLLYLLHILPLVFLQGMVPDFLKHIKNAKEKVTRGSVFCLVQLLLVLGLSLLFKINALNALLLSMVACVLLFFKRRFETRAAVLLLLAISIFAMVSGHGLEEKKNFVSDNLKKVFLNQSNYAKFIAREIVHQINSDSSDLYEFFDGNNDSRLENIWSQTPASRENIASGILVISKEDKLLSSYLFQIPFLKAGTSRFPLWAIEENTAEIHDKDIQLATASISVFKGSEHLGRIVVLVRNSPKLLLRYQDNVNIFTIDKKIDGKDISYIKLNSKNKILENPSNINLENVSGILERNDEWIKFESMELVFHGYIFKVDGNSMIIFFPQTGIFKELSDLIQLFLFFSLFYLVFFVGKVKRIEWRNIYYSYSFRVFSFLILISFLTAIVFSIFFINFSYRNSEQKVMRIMYENGRSAQNLGYNLIKGKGEFEREHLFVMSEILNSDVTVYNGSGLMETSNYRKYINMEIPVHLRSETSDLLNEKNQRFVLKEDKEGFHLAFKVYDYIFMVQYSNRWEDTLTKDRYYTDFVITIFFILMIIGFSTAFFFRNKILSPIEGLNHGMEEVKLGRLPILEKIPSEIEIKSLYTGFNKMIDGIREQKKSISEISQMKTIIRLGRHVAHEVKNPLTPIQLSAEQILRSLRDKNPNYEEIIKQSVNYIIDETEHLRKVSYGFLDLSRLDEISAESFDLVVLAQDEMFSVRQIYAHIDFSVEVEGGGSDNIGAVPVPVTLDKVKIKQVLKNLINNSIEAIGEKPGEVRVNFKKRDGRVILEVKDNGVGMDKSETERMFETDFSTKEIGTGLGLFIVKRIIELHKGQIMVRSEKDKGTSIILDLPETVKG